MRYLRLATALSLGLCGGVALADTGRTSQTETTKTTSVHQPASNIQDVNLFFKTDSAQLSADARAKLKTMAEWARCNPEGAIILEGYADPRGSQDHNLKLSGERAAMVRQELIRLGVPSERIVVTVYGENGPRRSDMSQERRVTARAADQPVTADELSG
jgi:outer membrane protein OmpA-like peptidoglycan-associated protein